MSRATRFKIYRILVITSIILIIPLLFIVGVTLPYLFNTIKVSFPEIVIGKDVEGYIDKKELKFKNTNVKVSRLARGLPSGGNLEYIDELTLLRSIAERVEITDS